MITVKRIEENQNDYFELFKIETIKDIAGKDFQVEKSIGQYSLINLKAQKQQLQSQIDEINVNIDAIEAL